MRHYQAMDINDQETGRPCDHPGCEKSGTFPAPRSRENLHSYFWFCLKHVRDYNAGWNFYAGMDTKELEAEIRKDTCWARPTWPLGSGGKSRYAQMDIKDAFEFNVNFKTNRKYQDKSDASGRPRRGLVKNHQLEALQIMDLSARASLTELKARYKDLVKCLHPDLNGQNRQAEERLKTINQAYSILKKLLA